MTALLTALGSGISAKKILEYLMRKSPVLAPKIQSALASGISADQFLKFFSKEQNFDKLKSSMEQEYPMENNSNPLVQAENIRGKNLGSDMASGLQRAAPGIIGAGASLGAGMALKHALPNLLKGPISEKMQKNPGMPSENPPLAPVQTQAPLSPNIPQTIQPIQPQGIINPKEYLEKNGILERVKELLGRGNTPEAVAAALGMKRSGEAKVDPELLKNIEAYAKEARNAPQELPSVESQSQKLDIPKEAGKIEKSSIVASPHGVGEVKEIRNGKAIVDIDGKKHQVNEDDLELEPADLEPAIRHILDSIPEKLKSSAFESSIHLSLPTGQDLMLVKFYDGKWAWYLDIPEQLYSDIATGIYEPKTSGKTGIAEYKPGVIDSRGAGFQSEIAQNPKYGKDQKGITWDYASNKYNAFGQIQGIVKNISKERYDEEGNLIQTKKRKK